MPPEGVLDPEADKSTVPPPDEAAIVPKFMSVFFKMEMEICAIKGPAKGKKNSNSSKIFSFMGVLVSLIPLWVLPGTATVKTLKKGRSKI